MTDKKPLNIKFLAIVGVVFLLLLGALFMTSGPQTPPAGDAQIAATDMAAPVDPAATTDPSADPNAANPPAEQAQGTPPGAPAALSAEGIDVNVALSDRILGDTSAAVRIAEHASFSCSHCANFHKNVFPEIKKNYIDTGKAYLVFSDFPLDQAAMAATMVSRCMPEANYWDFVSNLFLTQEDWARTTAYLDHLKKAAADSLSAEQVDACVNNKELQAGIEARMKGVAAQWNISSTPSFVINNKEVHAGALSYEQFAKIIDDEIAKVQNPANAPTATEAIGTAVEAVKDATVDAAKEAAPAVGAAVDALKDAAGEAVQDAAPAVDAAVDAAKDAVKDMTTPAPDTAPAVPATPVTPAP